MSLLLTASGGVVEADGSAAGSSTVTGIAAALFLGDAAAAGAGADSAASGATKGVGADSAGAAADAAAAAALALGAGVSEGAAGDGASSGAIAAADGSAAGVATVSGVGEDAQAPATVAVVPTASGGIIRRRRRKPAPKPAPVIVAAEGDAHGFCIVFGYGQAVMVSAALANALSVATCRALAERRLSIRAIRLMEDEELLLAA